MSAPSISWIAAARRDCVLTLQALGEFFYVTTRKRMVARTEAAAQLRDWTTAFPTISADVGAFGPHSS